MVKAHMKIGTGCLQRERNGTWTMRLMVEGKCINRSTGTKNKAEAKAMLRDLVKEQKELRERSIAAMSLLGKWDDLRSALIASGVSEVEQKRRFTIWRFFAEWMHEHHPEIETVEEVTGQIADEYMEDLERRNGATSCNSHMYALRGMFALFAKCGEDFENPWAHIGRRQVKAHNRRALTKTEIERLIASAFVEGAEWKILFLLGAGTGQGLAGCCAIKWTDIDLEGWRISIACDDGRVRFVTMNDNLHEALEFLRGGGRRGLVVPGIAEKLRRNPREVQKVLSQIFAKADIETAVRIDGRTRLAPDATFLSLRSSFIEFAAKRGVSLDEVKAIVGSRYPAVGNIYRLAIGRTRRSARPGANGDVYASLAARLAELGELRRLEMISEREYNSTCRRICREAR